MLLCQCPKLTPLQSRFLASVVALAVLGLIYWSLSDSHFAYAAELEFDGSGSRRGGEDHNWHRIAEQTLQDDGVELESEGKRIAARVLIARAPTASTIGGNDVANNQNIRPDRTQVWMYPNEQLRSRHAERGPGLPSDVESVADIDERHIELRKRDEETGEGELNKLEERQSGSSRTIYISMNTCLQPNYNGIGTQSAPPPQLTLYVSTEGSNTNPGPDGDSSTQRAITLDEGFANASIRADGDWYMSVHAPPLPSNFTGVWNYELAVSIDDYFHSLGNGPNLFLMDSDSTAALLVTNNLTQADPSSKSYKEWLDLTAPYVMFASNANDTRIMGISNSFCGLNKNSQIIGKQDDTSGATTSVQMEMITRGLGDQPKEQFYVTNLNISSQYHGTLARVGNSTTSGSGVVGGGGKVWQMMSFPTKSDGNCALMYNLTFCDKVAYAVPSTPDFVSNHSKLQSFYDDYTLKYYQNFNYSLQQIPCDTTADAQYSLVKTCDDCAKAYKEWLCAVSIPRCEDFSNTASHLQIRNVGQNFTNGTRLPDDFLHRHYEPMSGAPTLEGSIAYSQTYISSFATNSSRNQRIDREIAPGPYKEVLPCEDLCYSLVQSCPAALGFGCPYPGRGLEAGYGTRRGNGNGTLTCSYLGAYVYTGGAGLLLPANLWVYLLAGLVGLAFSL